MTNEEAIQVYVAKRAREKAERARLFGALIEKSKSIEELIAVLEPMPTAPPISQMAPAPRPRQSTSRMVRVSGDEEALPEGVAEVRSSRR